MLNPSLPTPPPPARALLRQIGALAIPTTALSMLQVGAQLVETVLAARQGTAALAGWAVMLPFVLLLAQMVESGKRMLCCNVGNDAFP